MRMAINNSESRVKNSGKANRKTNSSLQQQSEQADESAV